MYHVERGLLQNLTPYTEQFVSRRIEIARDADVKLVLMLLGDIRGSKTADFISLRSVSLFLFFSTPGLTSANSRLLNCLLFKNVANSNQQMIINVCAR